MHARRAAHAALLIAATATACTSGEPKTIRVTVTQTVTSSPSTKTAADTDSGILKMGATKTINDTESDARITVQVVEYQQPFKGPQPMKPQDFQGGDIWATINIKICNVGTTDISVSQRPWALTYSDSTRIESTGSSGGDMPKPEFPMDKVVKGGRCAAGLIAYPVPSSKHPERIVYEPDGREPIEWAVKH
ncbi:DUF4352 domain-containing protein [Streptomyces sp. NPDC013455]|uniref:DUF4352 domain-containing protein n=1 Tax=Streptomyces sp. NPDC013455 TaxID=3155605 RepID=UPI0033F91A71